MIWHRQRFYELYSAGIPLLMPGAEWMYRLLYQRGQLSVGERMYQATMPGYDVPYAEPWTNAVGLASIPTEVELRLILTLACHVLSRSTGFCSFAGAHQLPSESNLVRPIWELD